MRSYVTARSISRSVRERLQRRTPAALRILAVFEHACDLLLATGTGEVIALVTPAIGDGPLNVVVEAEQAQGFPKIEAGAPAWLAEEGICVGNLRVSLREATVWEPRPDWESLRSNRHAIAARLPVLRALCLERAPAGSLAPLLEPLVSSYSLHEGVGATAHRAARALRAGWSGDRTKLRAGAAQLAGLGSGLTPGGDDFLTGAMLWAWLTHPTPTAFCATLVQATAGLTTILSAAFLRAAARGECNAAWHTLLATLAQHQSSETQLVGAVEGVLAHGATSGADALAGFLWLGRT